MYKQNGQLLFQWGSTHEYNYDDWPLNVRYNGQDRGLDREYRVGLVGGVGRSDGWLTVPTIGSGLYRVTVEGCDLSGTGSHTCRQGWTNPLYINF
ncbi:hypothetical protein AB5J62_05460 [Amycolatopsis sp. cg5]|uniref:hypothetical protein n=1 Tax=Amycolatopsis sp. cg5 TaxID=3238802 RepID=UPI003524BE00